ncbi:MAG: STAS domain-containing protein [Isosphaeraceae bacterium]|nr:STAS domain-containing protein [Isosphaeraceae bacterium]
MPSFSTRDEAGILVVTLDDATDLNDFRTNAFRDALYNTIEPMARPFVALDLGATDYLSSSGIAILVGLKRRVESHDGKLVLTRVHPSVENLLSIMKLTQYFTFAADVSQALTTLRSLSTA